MRLEHGIARHEMGGLHFDFHLCSIGLCVVYRNENVSKAMIQFIVQGNEKSFRVHFLKNI